MDHQMFTLPQVAEALQLPYDVVRKAVYSGRWPHVEYSPRNRRMSQGDIDRVSEMLRHEPKKAPATAPKRSRSARINSLLNSA